LIEPWNWLMRLKVRLAGVPPCVAPRRISPWAMALVVAAAGPERVNSSAILRARWRPHRRAAAPV
jgi:hypothetical protein